MATLVGRVGIAPDIDVFTLPHSKMRQLIIDTTEEVCFLVISFYEIIQALKDG